MASQIEGKVKETNAKVFVPLFARLIDSPLLLLRVKIMTFYKPSQRVDCNISNDFPYTLRRVPIDCIVNWDPAAFGQTFS